MGNGWFLEPVEHGMAARGISLGRKNIKKGKWKLKKHSEIKVKLGKSLPAQKAYYLGKGKKKGTSKISWYNEGSHQPIIADIVNEGIVEKKEVKEKQKYSQEKADELVIKRAVADEFEKLTGRKMFGVEERSLAELRSVLKKVREDADRVKEMDKPFEKKELDQFSGTEYYYGGYMGIKLTDGVKWFGERAKANWLISDAAVILKSKLKNEDFVTIKAISKNNTAKIVYENGNGKKLYQQNYKVTDLKDGEYKFFFRDNVMMLPSEY